MAFSFKTNNLLKRVFLLLEIALLVCAVATSEMAVTIQVGVLGQVLSLVATVVFVVTSIVYFVAFISIPIFFKISRKYGWILLATFVIGFVLMMSIPKF